MKITLFLDIDGVFNGTKFYLDFKGKRKDIIDSEICEENIRNLMLCLTPNMDIVISSSWRHGRYDELLKRLSKFNFNGNIVGCTPNIIKNFKRVERGYEIESYIKEHDIKNYIILDDDCDMLEHQMPYFVRTNNRFGFTVDDIEKFNRIVESFGKD